MKSQRTHRTETFANVFAIIMIVSLSLALMIVQLPISSSPILSIQAAAKQPKNQEQQSTNMVKLHGSVVPLPDDALLSGPTDPYEAVKIVLSLKFRNESKLNRLLMQLAERDGGGSVNYLTDLDKSDPVIRDLFDPDSPGYGEYLSSEEFTERFSPSEEDYLLAKNYLLDQGFAITYEPADRKIIVAEGAVEQVKQAFQVDLDNYYTLRTVNPHLLPFDRIALLNSLSHSDAVARLEKMGFVNRQEPSIPGYLERIVGGVIGLNTFYEFQSGLEVRYPNRQGQQENQPVIANRDNNNSEQEISGYTAKDIATVYDYPNSNNRNKHGKVYSGKKVNIAIATAYGYKKEDLGGYLETMGVEFKGTITNIIIGGENEPPPDYETTLDIEQICGQAHRANVFVYEAINPKFPTFVEMMARIVSDGKAKIISTSWGLCEHLTPQDVQDAEHQSFMAAAAKGIAIFAASGDTGSYDCGRLSVDFPAVDTFVTGVGGTRLLLDENKTNRINEIAWPGSGGGISTIYDAPAWQYGPGVPTDSKRKVPDVCLNADPYTGYAFLAFGGWKVVGGTSAGAPNWAAAWSLVVERSGKKHVGNASSRIYKIGRSAKYAESFFDVVTGGNGPSRDRTHYMAGTTWDPVTGWGAPNTKDLIKALVKPSTQQ